MKKSKLLVLGLIALLLAGGLVLVGCKNCVTYTCFYDPDPNDGYTGKQCGDKSCAAFKASESGSNSSVSCDCY